MKTLQTVIDWLIQNKEWLFQGFGVFAIAGLVAVIRQRYFRKPGASVTPSTMGRVDGVTAPELLPSTAEIASRLRRVLDLMNVSRPDERLGVSDLAKALELNSPAEMDAYMHGRVDPGFEFLRRFSDRFGVNHEWLLTARGQPFFAEGQSYLYQEEYLDVILALHPEAICFVRSTDEVGESIIVLKIDDLKYIVLPNMWHISEHVGGTGRDQIISFYNIVRDLRQSEHRTHLYGRALPIGEFRRLAWGEVFPASSLDGRAISHWWDDLTDIEYKWTSVEGNREKYGDGFLFAQDVIRDAIKSPDSGSPAARRAATRGRNEVSVR